MKRSSGSAQFSALRRAVSQSARRSGHAYAPEDEVRMRHEVRDALEHAPGLEDERRERHFVKVHADS